MWGEKKDLNQKSDLFAVFSPAHCRMGKREGGVIVEVYMSFFFFFLNGGSTQMSWGAY